MADEDLVWEICRNYYLIAENPNIPEWRNPYIIASSREQLDLQEATENVKLCNWDHYLKTKGWIMPTSSDVAQDGLLPPDET